MIRRAMILRTPRSAGAAFALLLATSGAAGAQEAPAFTLRDSAGIPIAESTRPAWAEGRGWTVGGTPSLDFAVPAGRPNPFRLPDGRIAVAARGRLLFFAGDGTPADSVRLGPEDDWIRWMGLGAGDSLMAFTREGGLYAFTPQGRIARRVRGQGLHYLWPHVVGRLPDGRLLASEGHQERRDDTAAAALPRRALVRYVFLGADGTARGVFASLPDHARLRRQVPPFSWHPVLAVRGEDVLVGDNRRFQFAVYAPDGTARGLVRRAYTPLPVRPEDVEAWVALTDILPADPSPALQRMNERNRRERRQLPAADVFPAYDELLTDPGGNVWAHEARRPGDPQPRWSVFAPDGRWLGTVRMPDEFTLRQVGPDWVLGAFVDAEDDGFVRMYPLDRTPGEPAVP